MNPALFTDARPARHDDGTLTAVIVDAAVATHGMSALAVALPAGLPSAHSAGRYFLLRCGAQTVQERAEQWSIYLRRPLFVAGRPRPEQPEPGQDLWQLCWPPADDPGYRWLAAMPAGQPLNLIGPLGNGFALESPARRLLLLASAPRALQLLPLVEDMLDRSGHVTLVVMEGPQTSALRSQLPLSVEFQRAHSPAEWTALVTAGIRWADQVCAAIPAMQYAELADLICRQRFRLEPGYASMLVDADLACGTGACLACVIPLANGNHTRACVHGPVFDLLELVGKR
jgi:dihydroorotate dehydrogenase electron transfer subunit